MKTEELLADAFPGATVGDLVPPAGGHSGHTLLATLMGGAVDGVVVKAGAPGARRWAGTTCCDRSTTRSAAWHPRGARTEGAGHGYRRPQPVRHDVLSRR